MDVENGTYVPKKIDSNSVELEHVENGTHIGDKETATEQLEPIRTISRVPGNPNYYEKGGLRTEGDGVDHSQYNPVSI
jgi:hypothetical protein